MHFLFEICTNSQDLQNQNLVDRDYLLFSCTYMNRKNTIHRYVKTANTSYSFLGSFMSRN